MGWREKSERAKSLHRPSLKNWARDGLASTFPAYESYILSNEEAYCSFKIKNGVVIDTRLNVEDVRKEGIPVILEGDTPPEVFHKEYEAKCIPVVIRNIPYGVDNPSRRASSSFSSCQGKFQEEKKDCDDMHDNLYTDADDSHARKSEWPAIHNWSLSALYNNPQLRSRSFKVGEDDDGYSIKMKLRHFIRYLESNQDDSPLYVFDATFDEDRYAKRLLLDYTVPKFFDEDLFRLVGERRRPPYRWFLVGPQRSGTTVHIDPLGTSAWNTLIHGIKRWVLFPPHVSKSVVKGYREILKGEDDEAIHYFTTILPRVKRRAASVAEAALAGAGRLGEFENFECYEFTQYAGETVFIPHGWWHAVLNVTHTVGITQNYCSRRNFDAVWTRTRSGRKKMACTWLRRLNDHFPDLALRARELNRRDGFVMWEDDHEEQRRWMKKRAEKARRKREKEASRRGREGDGDGSESKRQSKKEKWGEHRTNEQRKQNDDDYNSVSSGAHIISPV
ncbi:hypothetical protein ACHAW6_005530 [Cyclotella cf. meneghiniana]